MLYQEKSGNPVLRRLRRRENKPLRLFGAIEIETRDRCYDFKNIFAEKFGEKNGVFDSKQS
jgi:hypothetical protein